MLRDVVGHVEWPFCLRAGFDSCDLGARLVGHPNRQLRRRLGDGRVLDAARLAGLRDCADGGSWLGWAGDRQRGLPTGDAARDAREVRAPARESDSLSLSLNSLDSDFGKRWVDGCHGSGVASLTRASAATAVDTTGGGWMRTMGSVDGPHSLQMRDELTPSLSVFSRGNSTGSNASGGQMRMPTESPSSFNREDHDSNLNSVRSSLSDGAFMSDSPRSSALAAAAAIPSIPSSAKVSAGGARPKLRLEVPGQGPPFRRKGAAPIISFPKESSPRAMNPPFGFVWE